MTAAVDSHAPADLPTRIAAAVFLPFAGGYFLSYVFRSINAVIAPDLVADFALSAADLGLLTSAYFLTFAAAQVPLGILLDRYGPRRTTAALMLVAGIGALVFSQSQGLSSLLFGRALIGMGVSACLMASIKAFTLWFPLARLPAMTGWVMFGGGIGAMVATAPVEAALHLTSWRGVFLSMSILTFLVSAAIFFVVPERAAGAHNESLRQQIDGLARVFRAAVFWRVAAASALFQATNMALQGLWAGPWLADVAGLDRSGVASNLLLLAAATTVGFLSWGLAASRLARYGISATLLFKIGTTGFLAVQGLLMLGVTVGVPLLWIAFGLFGTSGSLAYTILSHAFPLSMSGRANTALNMLVFLLAFTCQWAFGAIVNLWPAGEGQYDPAGYGAAFGVLFGLQFLAFLWLVLGPPGPDQPARARAALS